MAHETPAITAPELCLLHALPDLALAHTVSLLAPHEVFSVSSCSKSLRDACLAHLTTLTLHWRSEENDDSPSAPDGTLERWQQRAALLSLMRRTHSLKALELSSFEYLSMFGEVLRAGYGRTIEALALQDDVYADILWSVEDYGVIGCAMEAGALSVLKSLELGHIHEDFFRHVIGSLSNGPCPDLTNLTLPISSTSSADVLAEALEARARHPTRRCEPLRELTICSTERNRDHGFERLFVTSSVCDNLRELTLHGVVRMDFLASYLTRTRDVSSLEYLEVEGYTEDHEVDPGPDASPIFRALSHGAAPKLQSLLLERCHLNTDCAEHLTMAVARDDVLYHLKYLSLADVFEVQSEMTGFFSALAGLRHGCPSLHTIEFDHSAGSGACAAVAKCLNDLAFPRLQEVVIHARKVRDREILSLAEASLRRVKAARHTPKVVSVHPCNPLTRVVVSRQSGGVMHMGNQNKLADIIEKGAFRGVKELQLPVYPGCG